MEFLAQIQGGVGSDVWDKECFISAADFLDAAGLATAKAEEHGGQVTRLDQCDCSEAEMLDRAVNRFLTWPLPDSVCPDACTINKRHKGMPVPTGTNLLTATEARDMLKHVLAYF